MSDELDMSPEAIAGRGYAHRPMTPENLRLIANWLDTYDKLAIQHFDLLSTNPEALNTTQEQIDKARESTGGTEVQEDLRAWADKLEADIAQRKAEDDAWLDGMVAQAKRPW